MKKLIFFFLFFISVFATAQKTDTIFCTDGDTIICTINKIINNTVYYSTRGNSTINMLNLFDVSKYSLNKKSLIEPGIKYNPDIKSDFSPLTKNRKPNMDTIYYKVDNENYKLACTIDSISNNVIYCHRDYDKKVFYAKYNLQNIEKYVLGENSPIIQNIKYNPDIKPINDNPTKTILKDTSYQAQINVLNKKINGIIFEKRNAGYSLKNAGICMIVGTLCSLVGTGLSISGSINTTNGDLSFAKTLLITGTVFSAIGLGVSIVVPFSFINAGNQLQR